jgi:hypothetical protein
MTQNDPTKELIEADLAYSREEFQFTFTRAEVSAICASVETCRQQLSGEARSLCRSVLARIAENEQYQRSKRPASTR